MTDRDSFGTPPEILDSGPRREVDPRIAKAVKATLLILCAIVLVVRLHDQAGHAPQTAAQRDSVTSPKSTAAPPTAQTDLAVAFELSRPEPSAHETVVDLEVVNTSGAPLRITGATFDGLGVPVALEILSRDAAAAALDDSPTSLDMRFGQPAEIAPLSVDPGQWFHVLVRVRPDCSRTVHIDSVPLRLRYATPDGARRTLAIPGQDFTGALSWVDDSVGQACGSLGPADTISQTRIVDGIRLTTSGPALLPNGPMQVTVAATNLSGREFDGSIGVYLQGQMFSPKEGSTPYSGGLSSTDRAPALLTWRGANFAFNDVGWFRNGVLHEGERMVPGGTFVWTFQLTYVRPRNAFGETQGWLPVLVADDPSRPPALPDPAIPSADLM